METLESSRVCRLCGKHSGISINIFDENENHVRKINAMLPIMVHEMDLLPKHMCHRCSYKLEEFHKFYVDCLKTDTALKSQLSWMRKERSASKEEIGVPMVHIENTKIKTEPLDFGVYELEPIVENINYINSMAFPANGIHDGLTYTTISRCRCCCDNKNQSRSKTTGLCPDYNKTMPRRDRIAENTGKRTFQSATGTMQAVKGNLFKIKSLQDPLLRVGIAKNTRSRITTAKTKDISLDMLNQSHTRFATVSKSHITSRNAMVRNLRPRKDLVNYAPNKRSPVIAETSATSKSNITNTKNTAVSDFEVKRQIKVEKIDEFEERSLRPRKTAVDYHGPKRKKGPETHHGHRLKKCNIDNMKQNSKLHSMNEDTLDNLKVTIKQETNNDLDDSLLDKTVLNIVPRVSRKKASNINLSAKVGTSSANIGVKLRSTMANYLKSKQSRNKFNLLTERKSTPNAIKNKLAKSKINRFSTANYSPKYLRSQDVYLRNGKARKYDYLEWSMKRLQTKKLMDAVKGNVKKVSMLKLADSIKHYCETCNVSFMNMELFKLHECYFD